MSTDDRTAILARRALLVSTALAACSAPRPLMGDRTFEDLVAVAPPIPVNSSLPDRDRAELVDLREDVEQAREELRRGWIAPAANCAPTTAACQQAWRDVASAIAAVDAHFDDPCATYQSAAHVAPRAEQVTFWTGAAAELGAALEAEVQRLKGADEWENIQRTIVHAASACLSCGRSPRIALTQDDAVISLEFQPGVDAVGPAQVQVLTQVHQRLKGLEESYGRGTKLEVRGHADLAETDARELARKRAQRVVDWLVAKGAAPSALVVVVLGPELPIAARGAAKNRRVDFDIARGPEPTPSE